MSRVLGMVGLVAACLMLLTSVGAGQDDKKEKGKGPNAEAFFKKLDTNGDGRLSKDEFAPFVDMVKNRFGDEGADKVSKRFDELNKDGKGLSLDQFTQLRQAGGGGPGGGGFKGFDQKAIFQKLDTNNDGRISKTEYNAWLDQIKEKVGDKGAEFTDRMAKRFDELNTDGKGLTFEQFQQMRPAGKGGFKKQNKDE